MRDFGWTRLAYFLFVLTALTVIVRMGDSGVEARSLAAETTGAGEQREVPAFKRWTDDALSALEDARGEVGGPDAPKVVEPRVPAVPAPEDGPEAPTGQRVIAATEASGESPAADPGSSPPVFYRPPAAGANTSSSIIVKPIHIVRLFISFISSPRSSNGHSSIG